MLKISIRKNQIETHGAQFESQAQADAWITEVEANNGWGKTEGWYPLSQLSQEELATEIERREVDEQGNALLEPLVHIPRQYTIEIEDITAQVEQERINQEALAYLASTDWMVIRAQEDASKPVPAEVAEARQQARERIVK